MSPHSQTCPHCSAFFTPQHGNELGTSCPTCGKSLTASAAKLADPRWYYALNKQRMGPLSSEQLTQLAAAGTLSPTDMVLREGTQQWMAMSDVTQLSPETTATPVEPIPLSCNPAMMGGRDDRKTEATYPKVVTIAGILWIVFGSLILVNLAVVLLLSFVLGAVGLAEAGLLGGLCGGLLFGLIAAVFIHVGVQSVWGTARDTLGNGIGSIVIGFSQEGEGFLTATAGQPILASIDCLAGIGLLAAGILALIGRSEYKVWRKAQKACREGKTREGRP